MLADKNLLIAIKDSSLIQYNLKTRVENPFSHGSFISLRRITDTSFLVKSRDSLLLVNNLET
jgi:hypothetical protein